MGDSLCADWYFWVDTLVQVVKKKSSACILRRARLKNPGATGQTPRWKKIEGYCWYTSPKTPKFWGEIEGSSARRVEFESIRPPNPLTRSLLRTPGPRGHDVRF